MLERSTRTMEMGAVPTAGSPSPQRIRWGAVFAGVVVALALLALLTTLWFALAFNSDVETVRVNLEWYVGITAIASLFIGGLLAGWLSGVRGAGSGLFNGITMWGLILIVALAVGIPAIFNVFNLGRVSAITDGTGLTGSGVDTALWASFWTIGCAIAALNREALRRQWQREPSLRGPRARRRGLGRASSPPSAMPSSRRSRRRRRRCRRMTWPSGRHASGSRRRARSARGST